MLFIQNDVATSKAKLSANIIMNGIGKTRNNMYNGFRIYRTERFFLIQIHSWNLSINITGFQAFNNEQVIAVWQMLDMSGCQDLEKKYMAELSILEYNKKEHFDSQWNANTARIAEVFSLIMLKNYDSPLKEINEQFIFRDHN